jgi:DNA-directed RNA polymerase subunit F
MEPKIISQTSVSIADLKSEIEKIKKREKEPSLRVTKMEDYLNSVTSLSASKEKELVDALRKLDVPRMKDDFIFKIAEMLPKTVEDLKIILQGYVISVTNDNMKKIVDLVNSINNANEKK